MTISPFVNSMASRLSYSPNVGQYMAAYGAKLASQNAVLGGSGTYDNAAMPWVVFTDPQVAGVGLSEVAAKDAGFDVKTSIVPLDQVPRALAARDTRNLISNTAAHFGAVGQSGADGRGRSARIRLANDFVRAVPEILFDPVVNTEIKKEMKRVRV